MAAIKVNLGCASQVMDGWINVDYALGARIIQLPVIGFINKKLNIFRLDWNDSIFIHDLRKRFPWKTGSVDVVYSSHTLEHFSKKDGHYFLEECYRVLKKGGVIRIVVPGLREIVDQYLSGKFSADEFIDQLHVKYENDGDGKFKKLLAPFVRYPHKCMYDVECLTTVLSNIGFSAERKMPFDSLIDDIKSIEMAGRTENAAIVEGVKL